MVNPRPRLSVFERYLACLRVLSEGWSVIAAAGALGVSRQTIHKWLRRYRAEGVVGLADRSSRPRRMPRLTRIDVAVGVLVERVRRRWGPHRLATLVGLARSTVYALLRRAGLNRLGALVVRRPVLRYEWPTPGDLVHLDVKKLAKIPALGGWRRIGRQQRNAQGRRYGAVGYEFVHVAIDDHSRFPHAFVKPDERSGSAAESLRALAAGYASAGVQIKRVLTDNGSCYRSADFAAVCRELGIVHWRTKPYTPRTNGKAERFIKTLQEEWAYTRVYASAEDRRAALPTFLAEYRERPRVMFGGHSPMCRFAVNDVPGNHN